MTGSLARSADTQAMTVRNVMSERSMGGRGALLHLRGTFLGGVMTKVRGGRPPASEECCPE